MSAEVTVGMVGWCRRPLALLGLALALGSTGFAQDVGIEGPSYAGSNEWPTGSKPQSKLWRADGFWWGCLWSADAQSFLIHRLDVAGETWIPTETAVDNRWKSRADCLWDGARLYIASHRYTSGIGGPGHPLLLYRFSYDPAANVYSLDPGFPVQFGDSSTETLVIDKDSTGTLWAVWMSGLRVWTAHTLADDRTWSQPSVHQRSTSALTSDDICSVLHFGGNKIGVMWSDETSEAYWFTTHLDGAPDTTWSALEAALAGPDMADDHINIKAASDGRVFAALKTRSDEIRLQVRATEGTWSSHLVSQASLGWTRPIVALDEGQRQVHVYATTPVLGGVIFRKITSMDAISFLPAQPGTAVMRDEEDLLSLNDATTSKQVLDGSTGLVILASHQPSQRYWYHYNNLGGPQTSTPVAAFAGAPRNGYEGQTVQFFDGSSGVPTSWSWSFGDGGTSSSRNPKHTYTTPGTYSVSLVVSNTAGSDDELRTGYVTIEPAPTALVLTALEDAYVRHLSPDDNYGAQDSLRVREDGLGNDDYRSFLKFFLPETGNQVTSATLRLFCTDASPDGGTVEAVRSNWQESQITWNEAPALGGPPLGSLGAVSASTWETLDVSGLFGPSGVVSLGIASSIANSAFYSSREGGNPPELALTLAPPALPPVAAFSANRETGSAPLTVQFQDGSSGVPDSWDWDFGDGAGSSQQNPAHLYEHAGTYTVSLTVSNGNGSDTETRADFITVLPHGKFAGNRPLGDAGNPFVPLLSGALRRPALDPRSGEFVSEIALPLAFDDAVELFDEALGRRRGLQRSLDDRRERALYAFPGEKPGLRVELRPAEGGTLASVRWKPR